MAITHPNLKLAACGLLATSLLTACGGGSSSSAGGTDTRSYQQGVAHGTAATLALVLDDLERLQASLAGNGNPVQTNSLERTVTISISNLNLETRQRADLATQLAAFIAQIRMAQMAAADDGAGQAEATAAQAAANDAFRALQLVVAASTVAQAGGGEEAQDEAIRALRAVAAAAEEPDAADARAGIDRALENLNTALQRQVAELEQQLADAQDALGTQADTQVSIADLTAALNAARAARDTAQASLNARTERFGAPSALNPASQTPPKVGATYHPRRTGVQVWFGNTFDPTGSWSVATDYTFSNRGTAPTDGFDLTPDPVVYSRTGSNRQVFAASNPNTAHFPGRGTVYRGGLRYVRDEDNPEDLSDNTGDDAVRLYNSQDRLIVQGEDPNPRGSETNVNTGRWNNWDAAASMTFQYKANDGFTMGFGGEGVIFSDLERYTAEGQKDCGTGNDEYCDEPGTTNVELSFGTPQPDRYGEPHTHFWYVRAQSPRLPGVDSAVDAANAITPDLTVPGDRIDRHEMGRYEMILSAHAGENRRLSYAAYGLFKFIDFTIVAQRVGRMQTFHYGLDTFVGDDAFADDDNDRKTSDLASEDAIEGTFKGKTVAYIVTSDSKVHQAGRFHAIENLYRARGDIELRACIGGSGNCALTSYTSPDRRLPGASSDGPVTLQAGQIAGKISNLQYAYQNNPGHWTATDGGGIQIHGILTGADVDGEDPGIPDGPAFVELHPTGINDDGTYRGVTDAGGSMTGNRPGFYEGAFYGPAGRGMETAGTWQLNMANWQGDADAIIGSFGAICEGDCAPEPAP